ncbi:hypothetical protein Esti_000762 [Eimeria stiedai]
MQLFLGQQEYLRHQQLLLHPKHFKELQRAWQNSRETAPAAASALKQQHLSAMVRTSSIPAVNAAPAAADAAEDAAEDAALHAAVGPERAADGSTLPNGFAANSSSSNRSSSSRKRAGSTSRSGSQKRAQLAASHVSNNSSSTSSSSVDRSSSSVDRSSSSGYTTGDSSSTNTNGADNNSSSINNKNSDNSVSSRSSSVIASSSSVITTSSSSCSSRALGRETHPSRSGLSSLHRFPLPILRAASAALLDGVGAKTASSFAHVLAAAPESPDKDPGSLFRALAAAAAAAGAAVARREEADAAAVAAAAALAPDCSSDLLLQLHRHRMQALRRAETFAASELKRGRLPLLSGSSSNNSSSSSSGLGSLKLPPRCSSRWSLLLCLYPPGSSSTEAQEPGKLQHKL